MNFLRRSFYHLFKAFPSIGEAAADANSQIYDEELMSRVPDLGGEYYPYQITHEDGDPEDG